MWNPRRQDSVLLTFRSWANQIPNPVFQRQLLSLLQQIEETPWFPLIFKTRMQKHLPDLTSTKRGLIFGYPLAYDRVLMTFKTYLAAVETQSDILNIAEAMDYVVFKVQQAGSILSPNGVQHYMDWNEIEAIQVNATSFFARSVLDEFVVRYTKSVAEQPMKAITSLSFNLQA